MARPVRAGNVPAPRRRRWLLGGSALCGATLVFALGAQAQTLPGIPVAGAIKFTTGGALPTITAPTANSLDVALNATRTVINWDSFHVSSLDTVTYHFGGATDIVLNKSPTAIKIDAGGHITGLVGAAAGGNIWFYSPGGVVISPGAVMSAGNFVLAKGPGIDDAMFVDAASPLSVLRAASDSLIQIDTITLATGASISATGDLVLSASSGDLNATTALASGSATVSATTGAVNVGEVTAGGTATVTAPAGAITLGQLNGSTVSATGLTTVSVTSASATGASGDIILSGGTSASLGSGTAGLDIKIMGPSASLGSGTAGDGVFVTATTGPASVTGAVSAGDDIEVTATTGSVTATTASLTSTGAAAVGDAHVLAQSTGGSVSVGSATTQGTGAAAGDVTISGATGATLGSGHSTHDIKVLGPTAGLGSGSAADSVFVTATTGGATVTGAVMAGDDIEVTATTGSVTGTGASLISSGANAVGDAHVLVQSTGGSVSVTSAATQGTGTAAGDITVGGATSASLGSGNSSHNINVSGPSATLGSGSAARDVFVTATTGPATVTGAISAGDDIEVTATTGSVVGLGASLTSTGAGAVGDAHVLARSTGGSVSLSTAATQGTGAAAGDITVDGATGATLGSGNSSRDLKVLGPSAGLGFGIAARDLFVTATTGSATVTSQAVAGDDIEVTATTGSVLAGAADLKSNGTGAVGDAHVLAQSTGGSVSVGSAETQGTGAAAGDITVSGATTASLSSGASSHDLKVLAPTASLGSGSAANSVFVTATTGSATVTGTASAGNDIEVTATTGSVTTTGASLTATGVGAADDAHVLLQSTGGAVTVGSATTQGTGAAAGDITVGGSTTTTVTGTLNAARDVVITAGNSVVATGSTISAVRDVAVSATTGSIALGGVNAGDDIAVRALAGAITGSGDLESGQTHDAADPDPAGAADTLVGSTLTGHDIDLKAQTIAITGNVAAGRAPDVNETLGAAQIASTLTAEATNPDAGGVAALQLGTGPGKSVTAHSDVSLKAENAAAGSIKTGDVFAGGDVAVDSAAGDITMASALAGDDVVLRALNGAINVSGNVESGRDSPGMTPTDSVGAGDALNTARPFSDFDGNPATVFSAVGFDVNIVSQAVHVGGSTIAGRQPSTDAPNIAGPIDATTSDVRIETRISATPEAGVDPNITLGAVIATRDMQIDSAKAISTGALIAGRDVAVLGRGAPTPGAAPGDHTGAGTTIASAQAGDDALAFSVYGRTHILGSVTAGQPILRLVPTNDRVIDGATEAADQLAIYLHYFDLDNASAPYVLPGGVIHISGQGVTVGGALTAHGVGSDIRILSSLDIGVLGTVNAGGKATFQTLPGGGAVSVGAVTAVGDVFLDGGGVGTGVLASGALTSTNGQVAIRARDGTDISLASVSAGDDLVIRGTGALTFSGAVSAGGGTDAAGLGDALVASDGALTLAGHAYDLSGANVDIVAGSLTTPTTIASLGDVRIQTTGLVNVAKLMAGRDVLVDAGSTVLTGVLSAGRDIGVRSTGAGASVTIGAASAGDDLVVRAKGSIFATGTLSSGGGADSAAGDQAGDLIFGAAPTTLAGNLNLTGQNIDLRSSTGSITVTGAVNAASDARFQTQVTTGGAVTVGTVTAGRDLLLDGGGAGPNGVLATGTLTATSGDVAVRARDGSTVSLADVSAGDDVAIRGSGDVTISGAVNAGGGTDSVGLGDALKNSSGALTVAGHAYDLSGQNIDIVAAGAVTTARTLSALGDVRIQSTGPISTFNLTAGRDVLVDSGDAILTGVLSAGRDIGVRSTGAGASVTIGNASAGDDLVIRANGSIFATGTLTSGGGTDSAASDQAGDLIFGADLSNLNGALNLTGKTIDLRSTAGSITVTGAVHAATDARFQTASGTGGSVTVADVTAGRSVLLDGGGAGPNGVLAGGTVTATSGDVAVRARDGSAISLADVSAGDDVVLRATGAINVSGAINASGGSDTVGLGDALATTEGAVTLEGHAYDLTGHNVDVIGGSVATVGAITAAGDIRFQSIGVLNLGDMTAGRDVLVDGASAVTTGILSAGRDVGVRSTGDGASVTVGAASAGDDVVIRAKGSIFVTGALSAGGGADSNATDQAGDLMFGAAKSNLGGDLNLVGQNVDVLSTAGSISVMGAVTAATDAHFQTLATTGGSVSVAAVTAGRDVLLDGGGSDPNGVVATGTVTATSGDVAVRARDGKAINLAGITAGDDVVLRTTGAVTVSGPVNAGSGADSVGLGDVLLTTDGVVTLQGQTYDLTGHDVDIVAGSVTTIGPIAATGVASDVRVQSIGVINLGNLTAGRDVLVDGATTVATGLLTAGRDVGARSTGDGARLTIVGASAGDDVVIRAKGSIFVMGPLSAGGGADSTATDQAGDLMFNVAKSNLAGNLDLVGRTVDIRSSAGSIQVLGATHAATDARFQTQAMTGGSVTVGAVTAGRDILLDGAAGLGPNGAQATGALTATSGDVAIRGRDGASISLTDVTAGDDVVLRTSGDIQGSGTVTTTGAGSTVGVGDKLIDPSESGALSVGGLTFGLSDSDIDISGNVIGILRTTAVGGVRILAGSGSLMGGASAGTDILIDSNASLTVGDLQAAGDIALRSKSGSLTVGSLTAGDDIVLRAAQGVTAGMLKVGGGGGDHVSVGDMLFTADPTALGASFDVVGATIDVKSTAGPVTVAGAQGPGDIRLQTTGGAVTISGPVTAGRDFFADGGSVAATGALTAARDVALFARNGGVAIASVTAGNAFVARATGDVTASGDLKAGATPATGGVGDRLIAAGSGSATLFGEAADAGVGVIDLRGANITLNGSVSTEAGANLRLQSTGSTTLATATVAGDISIDAAGDLKAGDLSAGRDVALRASTGGITIASAKAGDDIVLRAANSIAVSGQLNAGQGAEAAGAGDALFSLSPTSLGGDFDLAGGNVDLKSTAGGISALGAITAPTDVRLQAAGAVVTGSVTAGRDLLLDGGSVSGADLHAGRDVAVRGLTDSVSLASATAGDDVVLRAAKDVTITGSISAGGAADSNGVGDRLFATDKTALNGDLDLAGANIDVRARGAITVGGAATATGDARFQTVGGGGINLAAVTAGGDVLADGAAVTASGALNATRDVAVRGRTGAVRLATLKAGDDIAIRAGGDVSITGAVSSGSGPSATGAADRLISAAESGPIKRLVDPLAATPSIDGFTLANGDIDIRSGGAIALGGDVNAAGSASGVHLQAAGKISAGAVTAGDSIFARGGDFALGGAWRADTARLEVTATGGLALGEGVSAPSGGVALSSSTIGLIDAPTLQIFLGDSSGTMRGSALSIGTLNIDVTKIKTSLELYAGSASQVVISGALAPSAGGANSTTLRIGAPNADVGDWTPGSIRVIANTGGSIGVSTTVGGRTFGDVRAFGAVELNATNDILFGYQDFIDKMLATTASGVSSAVRVLTAPQTAGGQRMLITAGTLTLRANGKVAQQDTEGLLGNNPMGLYLFGGSATAPQLVLGRTSAKSVGALTLPDYIELNGALTTGVTVLTGTNASLASVIAFANGVTPNPYYRLNSCAIMQPGSCTSSSVHSSVSISPDQLTNLTVQDRTAAAGTADPTVASATNEESWKDQK